MKKKSLAMRILTNLDAVICGTTLTVCVVLVNLNVVFRYFLNNPIKWTDEVVTSLFIWTVFMGSAYAHRRHAHLGVDIVMNLIHGNARQVIEFVMDIIQILILALLTYISAQYVCNLIWKRGIIFGTVDGVTLSDAVGKGSEGLEKTGAAVHDRRPTTSGPNFSYTLIYRVLNQFTCTDG